MKIISCAGYYGSGSSALTDTVSEYEGVKSLTDYEFRFIQDIDGLTDLEYHLVKNHHRHNAGHAIKRFLKLAEFQHGKWFNARYEPFFNGKFLSITRNYVKSLIEFSYNGYWYMDMLDRGIWFYYLKSIEGKIRRKIPFLSNNYMPNELTFGAHPTESRFLELTKKYLTHLFREANPEDAPYLMVDQLIPSSGINQCLRYFDCDIKVFVVTRDPRDIYLSDKYVWKSGICPRDPKVFCKWFRYTHESNRDEIPDSNHVMELQFEDLIYCYDNEIKRIEKFLGFDAEQHKRPFNNFNPQRSIHNTQLWKVYPDKTAMDIIERELEDYLYDFNKVEKNSIAGIKVNNIQQF